MQRVAMLAFLSHSKDLGDFGPVPSKGCLREGQRRAARYSPFLSVQPAPRRHIECSLGHEMRFAELLVEFDREARVRGDWGSLPKVYRGREGHRRFGEAA